VERGGARIWHATYGSGAPVILLHGVAFTLQMDGVTIIRNDVTPKRARLEAGEAYFFSAGDPCLRYAIRGTKSRAWVIEYVAADAADADAGGTIICKTDPIARFSPRTRDVESIRNDLLPGDATGLPSPGLRNS
jgi:hypothetical protein